MNQDKVLAVLISRYAAHLKEAFSYVQQTYGDRIANKWALDAASRYVDAFDPAKLGGAHIDIREFKRHDYESMIRKAIEEAKAADVKISAGLALMNPPYDKIYETARVATRIKNGLIDRGERETSSLLSSPSSATDESGLVDQGFYSIRPLSESAYKNDTDGFYNLLEREFRLILSLAQFLAGKIKTPFIGGKIEDQLNNIVQPYLLRIEVKNLPNWEALPRDLEIISRAFLEKYAAIERDIYKRRYEQ